MCLTTFLFSEIMKAAVRCSTGKGCKMVNRIAKKINKQSFLNKVRIIYTLLVMLPVLVLEIFVLYSSTNFIKEQQLLEETHCKVVAESHGPDNHIIYLSGGSGRDKALFAQCVNEFFDVIDNQRYILVKRKGHKGLNGFYAIPNCFAKKKEDAERFEKCMHPYIGNYDCVYTRNEKGRELLLEGRVKALANREERCISRKKVKGALE